MIMGYDTETTGLPDFKARSTDPKQPHLVQLALVSCDDDGNEGSARSVIIKPNGWTTPAEMTAIHGISHERAMDEGIPEEHAVALFVTTQARASLRVAHNESFDRRIMRIAMSRVGYERDFIEFVEARPSYCTCNAAKPIVGLPAMERMLAAGMARPKPPKLSECVKHFFDEDMAGAHDALVNARACVRIYQHIKAMSAVAEAERDRIRERVATVKADQKTRGRYLGGKVPFGFHVGSDGELVADEGQQDAIRLARAMREAGKPFRAIQAALEAQGHTLALSALHRVLEQSLEKVTA